MFKLKKNKYLSFSTSLVLFGIVTVLCLLVGLQTTSLKANATAASTLNFQARLLTSAGAVVPDGSYNIEFKLYNAASSSGSSQGSCTGDSHCEWVETYTGANKVTVNDGYLSVYLGSLNAFPNTIDWEQPLYLSMNVGGTSSSPTWDGEMTPRIQLTALPYAFIAGQLAASDSSGDRATLVFPSSLSGTATITIPDVTGTICLQSSSACGFASSTGSTSYVDINPSSAQSGGFNVTGTGIVGTLQATNVQTSSLDTSSSGTLNIGQTNATGISLDKSTTDTSSLTVTGTTALNNTTSVNSASNSSALSVTNAAGTTDLNVNTSTADVGVDSMLAPSSATAMLAPTISSVTTNCSSSCTTTYTYEVTAVSANGAQTYSSKAVSVSSSSVISNTISNTVVWSPVAGASYYNVYRVAGGSFGTGLIGSSTGASISDTGLAITQAGITAPTLASTGTLSTSSTYYYEVTALDSQGGQTLASTYTTGITPTTNDTSITVSWPTVTGAKSYRVYRSTSTSFTGSLSYYTVYANNFTDTNATPTGTATIPTASTAYVDNLTNNSTASIIIGDNGTSVGQVYVGGNIPSSSLASLSLGAGNTMKASYVQGNYEYVTGVNSTYSALILQVYDISTPLSPTLVGSYGGASNSIIATGYTVYVSGHYAYVDTEASTGVNALEVFDVSNPSSPALVDSLASGGVGNPVLTTPAMYVNGNDIYIVHNSSVFVEEEELEIIDISSPLNPVVIDSGTNLYTGNTNVPTNVVTVSGRYAYAATSIDTLGVYDISNTTTSSASPQAVGSFSTAYNISSVTVSGRYAYIGETNGSAGYLQVVDISNPLNPVLAGSASTTYPVTSITISGREAYLAEQAGAIQVADISTPTSPNILSSSITATPYSLQISGRYLYVISSGTTLQVYDLGGEYTQTLQAGSTETGSLLVDNNATVMGSESVAGALQIGGAAQIDDDLSVLGATTMQGGLTINGLATPATPTVTNIGDTAGSNYYCYEVVAALTNGSTIATTAASASPATSPNGCVEITSATLSSSDYNIVTWAPVPGAAGYYVYLSTTGPSGTFYQEGSELYSTTFTDTGISSVSSTTAPTANTTGYLTINNPELIKTNSTTAFDIQNASGAIVLDVNTVNSTVNIDNLAFSGGSSVSATLTPYINSVTPTPATGSSEFIYEVVAVSSNGAQTSGYQADSLATGPATLSSSAYYTVNWTPVSNASYYDIYRVYTSTGGYGSGLIGSTTSASCSLTCNFVDSGQSSSTATPSGNPTVGNLNSFPYYYEVTALDNLGDQSAPIGPLTVSTATPANDTSIIYHMLALSWPEVAGARAYDVYRSTSTSFTGASMYTVYTNSFLDSGCTTSGSCYYDGTGTPPTTSNAYADNFTNSSTATVTIGSSGTSVGQLYIGGNIPSSYTGAAATGGGYNTDGLYVQGNYAYVTSASSSSGSLLQVYDISTSTTPTLIGSASVCTSITGQDYGDNVYAQGSYVYVSCASSSQSTLAVVNVSNPTSPVVVGQATNTGCYGISGGSLNNIYVSGRYAYITCNNATTSTSSAGLCIYDISNPASPVNEDNCTNIKSSSGSYVLSDPQGIYVSGRYAYIANTSGNNMVVVDISSPTVPAWVSTTSVASSPVSITVQGSYAYVSTGSIAQALDISNPGNPLLTGQTSTSPALSNISASSRYLYGVSSTNNALYVYDISDPASFSQVGSVSTGSSSSPEELFIQGRYAYVITGGNTLQVYDMGGEYTQSLQAGSTETGSLLVDNNETIQGSSSIVGGLQVGGTASVNGGLSVAGSSVMQNTTVGGLSTPSAPSATAYNPSTGSKNYYYEVAAVSASGGVTAASSYSPLVTNVSTLSSTSYNIVTWAPVPGAVGYYVYRANSAGATFYAILSSGIPLELTGTSYTDNGTYTTSGTASPAPVNDTTASFTVENGVAGSSTSTLLTVNGAANDIIIGKGSTGETTPVLLDLDNGTTTSDPSVTTSPSGAMYYNYSTGNFRCLESGAWVNCIGGLLSSNTPSINSSPITALNGSSASNSSSPWTTPSTTIPAGYCVPGRVINISIKGVFSTVTSGLTIQFGVSLYDTTGLTNNAQGGNTTSVTLPSGVTNRSWGINMDIICDSTTTTTAEGYAYVANSSTAGTVTIYDMPSSTTSTQVSSHPQAVYVTGTWGASSSSSNIFTPEQFIVKGS